MEYGLPSRVLFFLSLNLCIYTTFIVPLFYIKAILLQENKDDKTETPINNRCIISTTTC